MRRWLREGSDEEDEYQSDAVFQGLQWNTEGVLMKTGQVQVVIHQLLACCQQMEILTGLIRGVINLSCASRTRQLVHVHANNPDLSAALC